MDISLTRRTAAIVLASAALLAVVAFAMPAEAETAGESVAVSTEDHAFDTRQKIEGIGYRFIMWAAEVLGIETDDLASDLEGGQTINDVADANGVDTDSIIDALTAVPNGRIDDALADGTIDESEAATMRAGVREKAEDIVNGEPNDYRMGLRGRRAATSNA